MAASMWALSVGLAVVLLVGHLDECSATPTSINGNNCQVVLRTCWRPFHRFAASSNFTQVTDFCDQFSTVETCMGACRESMLGFQNASFQVMTYLCDQSRREMMIEAAGAECFNDTDALARSLGRRFEDCVRSNVSMQDQLRLRMVIRYGVAFHSDELCSALETLASCVSENLAPLCGSLVAQIGETAFGIATRSLVQETLPACFVDQPEGEAETIPGSSH